MSKDLQPTSLMSEQEVEELAREHGLLLDSLYGRPRLTVVDDNTLRFVRSTEMTPFGKSLMAYTHAVQNKNPQPSRS